MLPYGSKVARLAAETPEKLIFVDSRRYLRRFASGSLKGNRTEVLLAAGMAAGGDLESALAGSGEAHWLRGLLHGRRTRHFRCAARPAAALRASYPVSGQIDIVGAGDSATSGIVTALLSGDTSRMRPLRQSPSHTHSTAWYDGNRPAPNARAICQ